VALHSTIPFYLAFSWDVATKGESDMCKAFFYGFACFDVFNYTKIGIFTPVTRLMLFVSQ
jgi:hypothetical protein